MPVLALGFDDGTLPPASPRNACMSLFSMSWLCRPEARTSLEREWVTHITHPDLVKTCRIMGDCRNARWIPLTSPGAHIFTRMQSVGIGAQHSGFGRPRLWGQLAAVSLRVAPSAVTV